MKSPRKLITVFEHQTLKLNQEIDGVKFDAKCLQALQAFYGKGVPYYSLIYNGVCFNEFVGVLQVGKTVIEVLPKADRNAGGNGQKDKWRNLLVDMLLQVGVLDVHSPSSSSLKLKSNSILDLYIELFVREVEYLLHTGIIKQYRQNEGNLYTLKGRINFNKHIQHNLIHKERFYTIHTTYDVQHTLHSILYKTICLLRQINTNSKLHGRIGALLLHFPEMPDLVVTGTTFNKIVYSRKSQCYKKAIDISRLLLLRYHPDLIQGRNDVLALMFDMNKLWEQFIYVSLRKFIKSPVEITSQTVKDFWQPQQGSTSTIRPDIILNKNKENCIVLDTKWKLLGNSSPSSQDLRQMYVYHKYYNACKVALLYPGEKNNHIKGCYVEPHVGKEDALECSVLSIEVDSNIKSWQKQICMLVEQFLK